MEYPATENRMYFVSAVIVCAGSSSRMGGINKQFLNIKGVPVVARSISAFEHSPLIDEIIIVTRDEDREEIQNIIGKYALTKVKKLVSGGANRQQSVLNGVSACSACSDFLAIHDGARPLIDADTIERTVKEAFSVGAAAAGVRVKDTVKAVDENGIVLNTPDRNFLRLVQTPQVFSRQLYLDAVKKAEKGVEYTDDCMLVEAYGHSVKIVDGSYKNIKITTLEDIIAAEGFWAEEE
ncbi:MAG: 2-C-methyl-D-erythritol 4-phosphate cytidylyltransferase [Oscillospiraceae bacterium]|nr:2-C-methyl-D-erythritol 4-phosphate cytidylyltransferase [Oscillospiraceae bacterium]